MSTEVVAATLAARTGNLTPSALAAAMREASMAELAELHELSLGLYQAAWIGMSIACGIAVQRVRLDPKLTVEDVAELFRTSRTQVSALARIYEEIVGPRIEQQGDNATFPIRFQVYYDVAVRAAEHTGLPALRFLEEAEDQKAGEPLTASQFRSDLVRRGALPGGDKAAGAEADGRRALAHLRALAEMNDATTEALAAIYDAPVGDYLEAAALALDRLRDARQRVVRFFDKGTTTKRKKRA